MPETGCCGLAGSFGYERDHYEVSMKVGEHVLLPAIRQTPKDALIVADGFSCRCQIEQGTDRRALHLAEVLQMAARQAARSPRDTYPEVGFVQERPRALSKPAAATLLTAGGLALGWLAWKKLVRT